MKKTLVTLLALVFVLSIAATALAAPANPFVDVPAKHWAYAAVAKLAQAGIVDGYGDGTFKGDQAMTRYEMAQVVAKAMARSDKADAEQKALIDKLAVEFAAELNNLGVRVANLEKNASTIKWTGDARIRYDYTEKSPTNPAFKTRVRIYGQANVNDSTQFNFLWAALNQDTMGAAVVASNGTAANYDATYNWIAAVNLTSKHFIGNVDLMMGRYSFVFGQTLYFASTTGGVDGGTLSYTDQKFKATFGYADFSLWSDATKGVIPYSAAAPGNGNGAWYKITNAYYTDFTFKPDPSVAVELYQFKNQDQGQANQKIANVLGIGFNYKLADSDFRFVGDYWRNSAEMARQVNNGNNPKAYILRVQYKQMDVNTPGSWHAWFEYLKLDPMANEANMNGWYVPIRNVKGYNFMLNYVFAKNVYMEAMYFFNVTAANPNYVAGAGNGGTYYSSLYNPYTGVQGTKFIRVNVNYLF